LIQTAIAFVLVAAALTLALREYLSGRRRDWPLLALGVIAGSATVSVAAWDWLADVGRRGDQASAAAMAATLIWFTVVGWRYIRPGS
jgi:hypothetical protein